jgi:hypothetical protein
MLLLCSLCICIQQLAKTLPKDKIVLVNLCGRGDKDMHTVAKYVLQLIKLSSDSSVQCAQLVLTYTALHTL